MRIFALIFILLIPNLAAAEYTDERFSIKGVNTYVNLIDDAHQGCWTNLGEVRAYIEDKLAENGAVIVKDIKIASVALNFHILAQRYAGDFCYGTMQISLNIGAVAQGFEVIGSLYRYHAVDLEPQNFNIVALDWLQGKLELLD